MMNILNHRFRDWRKSLWAVASFFLFSFQASAQSTFDVSILAGTCANCHGTDGRATGAIPSLAGRPASTLEALLRAYKSDSPPPGTTVMNRLAKGYSDEELAALARHFAGIPAVVSSSAQGVKK
jgi:sulfide dehydrogenase cytochrome subunit